MPLKKNSPLLLKSKLPSLSLTMFNPIRTQKGEPTLTGPTRFLEIPVS